MRKGHHPASHEAVRTREESGVERVQLLTGSGEVDCRLHESSGNDAAIIWVFGAGGGLSGPAHGLYIRLARTLLPDGVTSLRLDYRSPGDLLECVTDVQTGMAFLFSIGKTRLVLVGHSFGGAVVIHAGAASEHVVGVAALSSQSYGTSGVHLLSPRKLLLIHGAVDEVIPAASSGDIYDRAGEPKRLIIYPGCGHGLDNCEQDLDRDLASWIREAFRIEAFPQASAGAF